MLNICFSESARGLLRYANDLKDTNNITVCIPDDLSIGDIKNINDFERRKISMLEFLGDSQKDVKHINIVCKKLYQEFFYEIQNHQEIIIWYSNSPLEFCGMLYTLWFLRNSTATISMINCSITFKREGDVCTTYHSVGEVSLEEYPSFLSYIQNITNEQKKVYLKLWEKLRKENGQLRVFNGNMIKTADISYYDEIILKQIPGMQVRIGDVIGKTVGTIAIQVGDGLISYRIKALIKQGVLKQDGDNENFYQNSISKI